MNPLDVEQIHTVYQQLIDGWNSRIANKMAQQFTENGELIGFDGSHLVGRDNILNHLQSIFTNHPTPIFITKVKSIKLLSTNVGILRAIVGMIPDGQNDIKPELNAHQTLIAVKVNEHWNIELFQNTPAQFHGSPELVENMTAELKKLI